MWAAGVIILEMYAGGLAALPAGRGEKAGDFLEILVESSRKSDFCQGDGARQKDCSATSNGGGHRDATVGAEVEVGGRVLGASGAAGGNDVGRGRNRRGKLRVGMPEEVLEILREMFKREAGDRPVSMEVNHLVKQNKKEVHTRALTFRNGESMTRTRIVKHI